MQGLLNSVVDYNHFLVFSKHFIIGLSSYDIGIIIFDYIQFMLVKNKLFTVKSCSKERTTTTLN